MTYTPTRRTFLRSALLAGAAAAACPLPRRAAWAAPTPTGVRLKLAFFTDVHTRTEWDTPLALERAAAAINARQPDIVLGGGDLVDRGHLSTVEAMAPRWNAYMQFRNAIAAPVHEAPGNHDHVGARPVDGSPPAVDTRADFLARMDLPQTYRSLDVQGHHVILLDSTFFPEGEKHYEGRIPPEQLAWLKSDLAAVPSERPIIVVTHIPLLTAFYAASLGTRSPTPKSRIVVNAAEVLALLRTRNLLLVLQGHTHIDELVRWRGTTFITGGAVSGGWWWEPREETEEGFGLVTLDGDRAQWEYVDYGWQARRPRGE